MDRNGLIFVAGGVGLFLAAGAYPKHAAMLKVAGVGLAALGAFKIAGGVLQDASKGGGVAGALTDLTVGSAPEQGSAPVAPVEATPGRRIEGAVIFPAPGGVALRTNYRKSYPVQLWIQNNGASAVTDSVLFETVEDNPWPLGETPVNTATDPITLQPGERRQVEFNANTETVVTWASVRARASFAGVVFATLDYTTR